MLDQQALQRGRDWEAAIVTLSGGQLIPGSGNKWNARGDASLIFLVQCKAERGRSWSQTRRELREAIDDAIGSGRPAALAVLDDDDEQLFVCRLGDLLEVLSGDAKLQTNVSRGEERRRLASVPSLLRELEEGLPTVQR